MARKEPNTQNMLGATREEIKEDVDDQGRHISLNQISRMSRKMEEMKGQFLFFFFLVFFFLHLSAFLD